MDDAQRTECEASWREEVRSTDGAEARGYAIKKWNPYIFPLNGFSIIKWFLNQKMESIYFSIKWFLNQKMESIYFTIKWFLNH